MNIVLASRNPKKVKELRAILAAAGLAGVAVLPVSDFPDARRVEETGPTFAENAALKARSVRDDTGLPALADDSGLVVDALGGAPGIHSARFAGPDATDAANNDLLLRKLAELPEEKRRARFVCTLAFAVPGRETRFFTGETPGVILDVSRGAGGFGYDPLFLSVDLHLTFAEATEAQKASVSHRGRALAQFADWFTQRGEDA